VNNPKIIKLKIKLSKLKILIIFLSTLNTGNLFKKSNDSLITLIEVKNEFLILF